MRISWEARLFMLIFVKTNFISAQLLFRGAIFDMNDTDGVEIARSVQAFFENHGIDCLSWVTTWGEGCRRVSE